MVGDENGRKWYKTALSFLLWPTIGLVVGVGQIFLQELAIPAAMGDPLGAMFILYVWYVPAIFGVGVAFMRLYRPVPGYWREFGGYFGVLTGTAFTALVSASTTVIRGPKAWREWNFWYWHGFKISIGVWLFVFMVAHYVLFSYLRRLPVYVKILFLLGETVLWLTVFRWFR